MNLWTAPLGVLLCVITFVHVVHAIAAAQWVYAHGAEWQDRLEVEELLIRQTSANETRAQRRLEARIRVYNHTKGSNWFRFFGVKSYRLQEWALRTSSPWKRQLLRWLRFFWRWNRFSPGVSLLVLAVAAIPVEWPSAAQASLWVTAMLQVVGMLTMAIEGLLATAIYGSWAEDHHRWQRLGQTRSPVSILGTALWLGCALFSRFAASALVAVTVFQLHAYHGSFGIDWVPIKSALHWEEFLRSLAGSTELDRLRPRPKGSLSPDLPLPHTYATPA
jgi:hypothetical protein